MGKTADRELRCDRCGDNEDVRRFTGRCAQYGCTHGPMNFCTRCRAIHTDEISLESDPDV